MADSSRLLKADSVRGMGAKVVFNYDDLRQRCDDFVTQTREQARQVVGDAQREAEAIRAQARKEGLAAGYQEGLTKARVQVEGEINTRLQAQVQTQLAHVVPTLQQALAGLALERDQWLAHWEQAAIRLSVAIAERIIRRELMQHPELAAETIAAALQLAAGSSHLRLRMHPDDVRLVGDRCQEIVASLTHGGTAAIVPDASISRGGCVVETQHGEIDARLETQLQRIAEELGG